MSKSHRRVNPNLWDDEGFVSASDFDRVVYFILLAGPHLTACPGLQHAGPGSLGEILRRPADKVRQSLARLADMNFISCNVDKRVIWIPNSPKFNPAESPNHIRAWWSRWSEIPNCPEKYWHVSRLKDYANLERKDKSGVSKHLASWDETFGEIEGLAETFGSPPEGLSKGLARASEGPHVRVRARAASDTDTEQLQGQIQSQTQTPPSPSKPATKPKPKNKKRRAVGLPDDFRPDASVGKVAASFELSENHYLIEIENFQDHFNGTGGTKVDWQATARKWIRKSCEYRGLKQITPERLRARADKVKADKAARDKRGPIVTNPSMHNLDAKDLFS